MGLRFPFDPLERSGEVERLVTQGERRVYHRFRPAPYYGGIATADAVGCSFLCAYCWNYNRNLHPERFTRFCSADHVASRLLAISRKRGFRLFRITGAEPVLGEATFRHLVAVLQRLFESRPEARFVLETNGFFFGTRPDLLSELQRFPNLRVRVSLKGTDEESFEAVSGAEKRFFEVPLRALKALLDLGVRAWPALMQDLFSREQVRTLKQRLQSLGIPAELELEALEPYPFVLENLRRRNIPLA